MEIELCVVVTTDDVEVVDGSGDDRIADTIMIMYHTHQRRRDAADFRVAVRRIRVCVPLLDVPALPDVGVTIEPADVPGEVADRMVEMEQEAARRVLHAIIQRLPEGVTWEITRTGPASSQVRRVGGGS